MSSDNVPYTLPVYSITHRTAEDAIAGGASIPNLNFDSGPMDAPLDSGLGETGAIGSVPGPFQFFRAAVPSAGKDGLAQGALNALTQLASKASSQRITISGRIGSYATLASSPGSWYSSNEVARAWNGNGDLAVWDAGAASGGWKSFFDPNIGSLARYVSQLVLVSGYQLTVTVYGQYTQSEVNVVQDLATWGAWPLFGAAAPPTQTVRYQLNSDLTMSVVQELGPGKIQIWGVNVQAQSEGSPTV